MSEFRVAEHVRWAVEAAGVVLINDATGASLSLGYSQAAIWDFLARGESRERIVAKVCAIAGLDPAAAQALMIETIAAWWEAGFVAPEDSVG
jgi:hypothetical protein